MGLAVRRGFPGDDDVPEYAYDPDDAYDPVGVYYPTEAYDPSSSVRRSARRG